MTGEILETVPISLTTKVLHLVGQEIRTATRESKAVEGTTCTEIRATAITFSPNHCDIFTVVNLRWRVQNFNRWHFRKGQ